MIVSFGQGPHGSSVDSKDWRVTSCLKRGCIRGLTVVSVSSDAESKEVATEPEPNEVLGEVQAGDALVKEEDTDDTLSKECDELDSWGIFLYSSWGGVGTPNPEEGLSTFSRDTLRNGGGFMMSGSGHGLFLLDLVVRSCCWVPKPIVEPSKVEPSCRPSPSPTSRFFASGGEVGGVSNVSSVNDIVSVGSAVGGSSGFFPVVRYPKPLRG